jgi:hypothetical protein
MYFTGVKNKGVTSCLGGFPSLVLGTLPSQCPFFRVLRQESSQWDPKMRVQRCCELAAHSNSPLNSLPHVAICPQLLGKHFLQRDRIGRFFKARSLGFLKNTTQWF